MGTNYYAKPREDPLNLSGEGLHIGKSSGGWEFLWRAHKDRDLISAAAWRETLSHPSVMIVAEYGLEITLDEFWAFATHRLDSYQRQDNALSESSYPRWRDDEGYPFADYEFC